jgi:hypothetical protein
MCVRTLYAGTLQCRLLGMRHLSHWLRLRIDVRAQVGLFSSGVTVFITAGRYEREPALRPRLRFARVRFAEASQGLDAAVPADDNRWAVVFDLRGNQVHSSIHGQLVQQFLQGVGWIFRL